MKAMVLAAGFGSRFSPHSLKIPKPAFPFLNVPMGFHCFQFLKNSGVESLVINTHHLPEKITELYKSQSQFNVEFSPEPDLILGSSGGLKKAQSHFANENTLLLLNADEVIFTHSLQIISDLLEQHHREGNLATLLVTEHPEVGTKFGGVWVDSKNQIVGFGKTKPANAEKAYHFIGVQALQSDVFNLIPENKEQNIFYDTLQKAFQQGERASVHPIDCHWFETGNLHDYLKATKMALQLLKENKTNITSLKSVLKTLAPESDWLKNWGHDVWGDVSSKATNSKFMGFSVIGKNVKLNNLEIENAVFHHGVQLNEKIIREDLVLPY
ncbi:MAG: NDP-sugar synthase [Bdellovibrionales bacterium]